MDKSPKFNVRVGHVCLEVSNVVEAKKFYGLVLRSIGFEIILEDEGAGWSEQRVIQHVACQAFLTTSPKEDAQ